MSDVFLAHRGTNGVRRARAVRHRQCFNGYATSCGSSTLPQSPSISLRNMRDAIPEGGVAAVKPEMAAASVS
jgi:hypothetical protein